MVREIREEKLPEFAALSRCLVIESSFQCRSELLKDLKSCGLFEETIIPPNVSDSLFMLAQHEFDACYIGPSLSHKTAETLLRHGCERTLSKDCAFIALLKNRDESSMETLQNAHGEITWPCTKREFFEGSVLAILRANKNTRWPGIQLSDDGKSLVFVKDIITQDKQEKPAKPKKDTPWSEDEDLVLDDLHVDLRTDLREFLFGVDEEKKAKKPQQKKGLPPEVLSCVQNFLQEAAEKGSAIEAKQHIDLALLYWPADKRALGMEQSLERLKRRLRGEPVD